jgi:hypothetical protein
MKIVGQNLIFWIWKYLNKDIMFCIIPKAYKYVKLIAKYYKLYLV